MESSTEATTPKPKCFIATPIGGHQSDIRENMHMIIEMCFRPVLWEMGYDCISPEEMAEPGHITDQVIRLLASVEMVIANLTEPANPNVMYELAVRHAARKPVVIVKPIDSAIPFDIADHRVVSYESGPKRFITLRDELKKALVIAANETDINNPIYRALERELLFAELSRTGNDLVRLVLSQFESIGSKIATLRRVSNLDTPLERPVADFSTIFFSITFKGLGAAFNQESLTAQLEAAILDHASIIHVLNKGEGEFVVKLVSKATLKEFLPILNVMSSLGWSYEFGA